MLIVQGCLDTTVPAGQSLELLRALYQRGVPLGCIAYAGGHEFSGLTSVKGLTPEARELDCLLAHYLSHTAQRSRRRTIAARIAK